MKKIKFFYVKNQKRDWSTLFHHHWEDPNDSFVKEFLLKPEDERVKEFLEKDAGQTHVFFFLSEKTLMDCHLDMFQLQRVYIVVF